MIDKCQYHVVYGKCKYGAWQENDNDNLKWFIKIGGDDKNNAIIIVSKCIGEGRNL